MNQIVTKGMFQDKIAFGAHLRLYDIIVSDDSCSPSGRLLDLTSYVGYIVNYNYIGLSKLMGQTSDLTIG
jgi:hypothetical protein